MTTPSEALVNRNLNHTMQEQLIAALAARQTDTRRRRMQAVLEGRTRRVCLVLEDIFQPHNAAACFRTCEAFGVQDVHFIINRNDVFRGKYASGVAMGSDKWLTKTRWGVKKYDWKAPETSPYEATSECLHALKEKGYRIVATTLREDSVPPESIPLDKPIALLIGSEERGLSDTAHRLADMAVQIPMQGFVQSLNLSVCAALLLRAITLNLRERAGHIGLSEEEKRALYLEWLRKDITGSERIEAGLFGQKPA